MMTMLRKLSDSAMRGLVMGLGVVLAPAFSYASEAGESKAGLPQLDVTLFPAQLFWLALTFITLYILMAYVALPSVKRTQDRRHETLSGNLSAAEAANESAKAMIADYEQALVDARVKAQATVGDMIATAAKEAAAHQAAQKADLSQRLSAAEAKITAARDDAVKNLQGTANELASSVVEKVSGLKGAVHG